MHVNNDSTLCACVSVWMCFLEFQLTRILDKHSHSPVHHTLSIYIDGFYLMFYRCTLYTLNFVGNFIKLLESLMVNISHGFCQLVLFGLISNRKQHRRKGVPPPHNLQFYNQIYMMSIFEIKWEYTTPHKHFRIRHERSNCFGWNER